MSKTVPPGHGYIDFVGEEEHFWHIETLWQAAADLPIQEVALDQVDWWKDGCHVLSDPPLWGEIASHCKRAMAADLSYPIIVDRNWLVVDGIHRLIQAYVTGRTTISVVRLDPMPEPDRIQPRSS